MPRHLSILFVPLLACGIVRLEEVPQSRPLDADARRDADVPDANDAGVEDVERFDAADAANDDAADAGAGDAGRTSVSVNDDENGVLQVNGPGYRVVFREDVAWAAAEFYVGNPLGRDLAGNGHERADGSVANGPFRDSLLDPLQLRIDTGWQTISQASGATAIWEPTAEGVRVRVSYLWVEGLEVRVVHSFAGRRWDVDVVVEGTADVVMTDVFESGYMTVNRDVDDWLLNETANSFGWRSVSEGASIVVSREANATLGSDDFGSSNRFFAFSAAGLSLGLLEESFRIDIAVSAD